MIKLQQLRLVVTTFALLFVLHAAHAVTITAQPDGSYAIAAAGYTASVSNAGHFTSLKVRGTELLLAADGKTGGVFPGGPAAGVALKDQTITASRDEVRASYTFDDTGFTMDTVGGSVEWWMGPAVKAYISRSGEVVNKRSMGDVQKVVAGDAVIQLSEPFHIIQGRLLNSRLTRGGKPADAFKARIDCNATVEPIELVNIEPLSIAGVNRFATPMIAAGQKPTLEIDLRNYGPADVNTEVQVTVVDHHTRGKTVHETSLPAAVPPTTRPTRVTHEFAMEKPGLYWVNARILRDGKAIKSEQLGVVYDAFNYRPPLTRPADFAEFWAAKLKAMRAIAFNEKLTENVAASNEKFIHYDLELAGPEGKPIKTFLRVPRVAGPHDAEVHSYWGSTTADKILASLTKLEGQPAGVGMGQRGGNRIRAGAPQPDDSTYTRWNGRDDNNMLDSYLMQVRIADYLRWRKDTARIWYFGASRSGASMLAAAALSPERVAAVNVHVPTCCGISWADKPYQGWGKPPAVTPEGLKVAAYFDPVNFAPDIVVPLVLDGGFYDNLAPAPGILAFHNWAEKAPFKRVAINLGGHGYFPPGPRQQMEKELGEYLAAQR